VFSSLVLKTQIISLDVVEAEVMADQLSPWRFDLRLAYVLLYPKIWRSRIYLFEFSI